MFPSVSHSAGWLKCCCGMVSPDYMAQFKQVLTPDFTEGVDRKLLKQVRDRFLKINAGRLSRAKDAMSLRQRDIIDILPLLYHVNHPLLPGYVAQDAPKGVSGYLPDKPALGLAKSFSQSFKFSQDRRSKPEIHSLFMMGSTGTLAHSESSDVDLWCCYRPGMDADALAVLKEKAARLDEWANSAGLELHTFLMDAEAFKKGQAAPEMNSESSGSAQHFLLLDEFYRTAILLAGRYPLWWLIPSGLEDEYDQLADRLIRQRFVRENEVIDFGHIAEIPKSELLGAGLWQLYKSIDAPYKSVLKLLLAEVYAQELPEKKCLSLIFKRAVYEDEAEVEQLDPYLLIYRRLESYLLERNEIKRLDLVRKSFYLKVNKKLSKKAGTKGPSWQRLLLQELSADWAWREQDFKRLDERSLWRVDQVISERQQLLAELTNSYRFLSDYARVNKVGSSISAEDLSLLGRKLNATFERKAGKVEKVNPGIAPNIREENLALHHGSSQPFQSDQSAWHLYRDLNSSDDAAFCSSLKKTPNLIEMLAWLHFNDIAGSSTRLSLVPGTSGVSLHEVRSIMAALERAVGSPSADGGQERFLAPAYVNTLVLFINIGVDPMERLSEHGLLRLSDRTDSLGYSSQRSNLVKTIDQVALNSWNEMSARRYELGETLMQNLQAYLLMSASQMGQSKCRLHVFCYTSQRAEAIAMRVETLFKDVSDAFFIGKEVSSIRYVLEIEERFYIVQYASQQFRYSSFSNVDDLLQQLGKSGQEYSQIVLDRYALRHDSLLRQALKRSQPDMIQIFYELTGSAIEVCFLDECGSVLRTVWGLQEEREFLLKLDTFLTKILERRQFDQALLGQAGMPVVNWYRGQRSDQKYEFRPMQPPEPRPGLGFMATAFYDGPAICFDLSFEDRVFSFSEYGNQQVEALVHYLRQQGREAELPFLSLQDMSYPSDPVLMRSQVDQSRSLLEYLRLFQSIEMRLWQLLN